MAEWLTKVEKAETIRLDVPDAKLIADLEKYCNIAKELGATDAKFLKAEDIVVDDRTPIKCLYPKCHNVGISAYCPPSQLVIPPSRTRELVKNYKYAIAVMIRVPADKYVTPEPYVSGKMQPPAEARSSATKVWQIMAEIERRAFYDGYYFALGFGSGPCRSALCQGGECALIKGEQCKFPLRSRPACEAVGIDVFATATKLGWEIYPIGQCSVVTSQPYGMRMCVVLVH